MKRLAVVLLVGLMLLLTSCSNRAEDDTSLNQITIHTPSAEELDLLWLVGRRQTNLFDIRPAPDVNSIAMKAYLLDENNEWAEIAYFVSSAKSSKLIAVTRDKIDEEISLLLGYADKSRTYKTDIDTKKYADSGYSITGSSIVDESVATNTILPLCIWAITADDSTALSMEDFYEPSRLAAYDAVLAVTIIFSSVTF